jgi:hypothetical protein
MKLDCVMKDSWKVENFPFDKQSLRFTIENSQFDSSELVFKADTSGKHLDAKYTIRGWNVDSLKITNGIKVYQTDFGDIWCAVALTEHGNIPGKASGNTCWYPYGGKEHSTNHFKFIEGHYP